MVDSTTRHGSVRTAMLCATALAAGSISSTLFAGGVVLPRHADSLTTYRPSSTTSVQGVRPHANHRAVNIDGSGNWPQAAASASGPSVVFAKNPPEIGGTAPPGQGPDEFFGCGGGSNPPVPPPVGEGGSVGGPQPSVNGVDLSTGALRTEEIDIRLPAPGFSWSIARSYSAAQRNSGGTAIDSDGYQGRNWFQDSQPEVVFYDDADDELDMVYVVWGATAYSEFKRTTDSSTVFAGVNGTLGLVQFAAGTGGEPDLWTLTNADGFESKFFASGAANGQLWKVSDPAGNVAYVGDASTASTAVTNGYDTGRITKAYDSADRRYTYSYSPAAIGSTKRLASVIVETKGGIL